MVCGYKDMEMVVKITGMDNVTAKWHPQKFRCNILQTTKVILNSMQNAPFGVNVWLLRNLWVPEVTM